MKQSDAVKKWKKDKPVLLTDTGVSEALRKLPEDWTVTVNVGGVEAVLKNLKTLMADKKISASKSATACLTDIRAEVKKYLAVAVKNRARCIEIMKELHKLSEATYDMCASRNISLSKLKAYPGSLSALRSEFSRLQAGGRDTSAIPTSIAGELRESLDAMVKTSERMAEIVEDAMSKEPKRDIKKELPVEIKKFKANLDELPSTWKAGEKLS